MKTLKKITSYIYQTYYLLFSTAFLILSINYFLEFTEFTSWKLVQQNKAKPITQKAIELLDQAHKHIGWDGVFAYSRTPSDVLFKKEWPAVHQRKRQSHIIISSISKTFTSAAILKLEERKLLRVSDTLCSHLKSFCKKDFSRITIQHLLSHTSGLSDYYSPFLAKVYTNFSHLELNKTITALEPKKTISPPGEEYHYSNYNYLLLSRVIETILGTSFADAMDQLIFHPLNLKNTFVLQKSRSQKFLKGSAVWTFPSKSLQLNIHWLFPAKANLYGAGAIISTAEDLLRWGNAVLNKKVLSEESHKKWFKNQKNNYALGWVVEQTSEKKNFYWHNGSVPGHHSELFILPKTNEVIVLLANVDGQNDERQKMRSELHRLIQNKNYLIPTKRNWLPQF